MEFSSDKKRPLKVISLWFPVFGWAGLIFYLSSVPHLVTNLGVWDLIFRKSAHIFEYMVLALLMGNAWIKTWVSVDWGNVARWCILIGLLYAVSDEMHQALVPGRGPSAGDVMIDGLGVILGVSLTPFLLKWVNSWNIK